MPWNPAQASVHFHVNQANTHKFHGSWLFNIANEFINFYTFDCLWSLGKPSKRVKITLLWLAVASHLGGGLVINVHVFLVASCLGRQLAMGRLLPAINSCLDVPITVEFCC